MKMTYDAEADVIAIDIDRDANRRARGERLPWGEGYVDLTADGTILAIELWNASQKYPREALNKLQATGAPMSLAEAAKLSGVPAVTLRRACDEGRLMAKKIGRNWTVTSEALLAFLPDMRHRRQQDRRAI